MTPQNKINERFFLLFKLLQKCSAKSYQGKEPIFSIVERIFINQERGQLLQGLGHYTQKPELELKIIKNK